MVVEVSYLTWTEDGLLRHVVYLGEREDKPAAEVQRGRPTE
jgi:ATP-dependent DNA ligase